jgi:hypothetical protein
MKNPVKQLLQWCPQPCKIGDKSGPTAALSFSPKMLTVVILVEVLVLLIAPLTVLALLGPTFVYSQGKEVALTDDQIKNSWPNLPTSDEIKNSGVPYNTFNSYSHIQNRTRINMPVNIGHVLQTVRYCVYVPDNTDYWIEVPFQYLNTENPPEIQPDGFIGTYLPTAYFVGVSIILVLTAAFGIFVVKRNKHKI